MILPIKCFDCGNILSLKELDSPRLRNLYVTNKDLFRKELESYDLNICCIAHIMTNFDLQ